MIHRNPFTSETFTDKWCLQFNKCRPIYAFSHFKEIRFYKSPLLPLFVNVGKNLTKGMSYVSDPLASIKDLKGKVLLIYDVPEYFEIKSDKCPEKLKKIKVRQYPGFIANLENYKDYNDYLSTNFSKKSRYKFKSYKRHLENSFNITYKHIYGEINKDAYDAIFDQFYGMLSKRFDDKSETNNNLNPNEWEFYKEVVYPLILEKKASLFVIYQADKPIAISLNYFSKNILFFAITGFDIDFSKFNVGTVHLMELFKWCFDQKIKIFDFSKGYYDYKARWGDLEYRFENHIFYDSKSIYSTLIAHAIASFFRLKQFLRDKNIGGILNKFTYYFKKNN